MELIRDTDLSIRTMSDTESEYQLLFTWRTTPEVQEWLLHSEDLTLETIKEKYRPRVLGIHHVHPCIIEVAHQPVGYIQFYETQHEHEYLAKKPFFQEPNVYAIDIFLGKPDLFGKGIGSRALKLMIEYLVREKAAKHIIIDPDMRNARAIRAYEKAGFQKFDILKNSHQVDGTWMDSWLMIYRPSHRIDAIIWDMDGTIFDTERLVMEVWTQFCEEKGYGKAEKVIRACIGRNARDNDATMRRMLGEDFPVEEFRMRKGEMIAVQMKEHGLPLKPGIRGALVWIREQGIPMAIASSSDHKKILRFLESSGLREHFQVIVGGDQIEKGKPDPEMYLKAAELLHAKPERCIVFEDSAYGIIAAHQADMSVVYIPDLAEVDTETRKQAHHQLLSAHEVPALLSTMLL